MRLLAALATLGTVALLAAGCGGSGGGSRPSAPKTTTTAAPATTPTTATTPKKAKRHRAAHQRTSPAAGSSKHVPRTRPLSPAAKDYLTAAVARDKLEIFLGGVAQTRTSNTGVRRLIQGIVEERGKEVAALSLDAKRRHRRLPSNPLGPQATNEVRRLITLRGARLDAAYLRLEDAHINAAIAQATAAQSAATGAFARQLAGYLRTYRSELAAARALGVGGH